jgi:DNA-binding Xre family transcriptional regulator
MIKYKLRKLIGEKAAREDRAISLTEIAAATGINRVTLSKMANNRPYNASLEVVGQLCAHFNCRIQDVVEYVPEPPPSRRAKALAGSKPRHPARARARAK